MHRGNGVLRIIVVSLFIFVCGQILLKYGIPYVAWLSSPPVPVVVNEKSEPQTVAGIDDKEKVGKNKQLISKMQEQGKAVGVVSKLAPTYDIQSIAKLYETFAGFITTLLTIISALGVLFAYIIRKNIRELETEIKTKGETQISEMKKAMSEWEGTFSGKLTQIDKLKIETEINLKRLEDFLADSVPEKRVESPQEKAQELELDEELKDMDSDMGTENGK